jgi:alpha-mannosidase
MSAVTKSWAFRSTHGKDWATAEAIARERIFKYGGEPTGEIYYSPHKPGKRKRMKHVMKKNSSPFFSYIEQGDGGGGDGGESLTHRLFKEAIASIETTELRLGANGDHKIRVTHASTEKRFPTVNEYYSDVFLNFESETPLGIKWSGEVYIEVHNTNAVHATKRDDLRNARIPVIEVGVPELFVYPYEDSQTTDNREAQHLEKIKRVLEKAS